MPSPKLSLSGVVLDCPDAHELAAFYQRLLGWPVVQDEPGWMKLSSPDGGPGLSFQTDPAYQPPVWPAVLTDPADPERSSDQQMMMHLDIKVDDLEAAGRHASAVGATLAQFQPQPDVRVYLDPAGHPFCLFLN